MQSRNTIQLALVYEAVARLACHATADEIYEEITIMHPTLSRGTVYRNLNKLSECGKISKIRTVGGADHYDHLTHKHYHVQCEKCGRVFDVDMPYIEGLEQQVQNAKGFEIKGYSIIFNGICPSCKKEIK